MALTHAGWFIGTATRITRCTAVAATLCVASAGPAWAQPGGTLVQWGASTLDQRQNTPAPTGPYSAISGGTYFSIALKQDGTLVQWGSTSQREADNLPAAAGPYREIAAGASHGLALKTDGSLVQWGRVWDGQANGMPPAAGPYTTIAAGLYHNLALKADGSLVQWGDTYYNQRNGFPSAAGPYMAIAAGGHHSLALRTDGSLVQWGQTSSNQAVGAPSNVGPYIAIAAGSTHSLALKADGSLVQWGDTSNGQFDNAPPAAGPYVAIAAGVSHSLALRSDGTLVQWGRTNAGILDDAPSPAGPYRRIAAGAWHSLAITGVPNSPGSFTYQGQLGGASGPVDLRLRLFNALTGGSPVGLATIAPSVSPASNGVFTVTVNPGPIDAAQPLWLEIGVAPAGSDAFTTLNPRQPQMSTPLAYYAARAGLAQSANTAEIANVAKTALTATNATNATSAVNATSAGTAGSVPWSGVTDVPANVANAFSPWNIATGGIVYSGGRVGIGTPTPAAPLHVASGAIGTGWQLQLTNSASLPTYETGMRMSDGGFFEITNRINGFTRVARLDSNGGWTSASDARLKTDQTPFDGALETVLHMRPVRFKWIDDGTTDFGVIAQELRSVLPEAVIGDETRDGLTVNYSKLSVVAIGAVQEQQGQIEALKAENGELRARLNRLESAILRTR